MHFPTINKRTNPAVKYTVSDQLKPIPVDGLFVYFKCKVMLYFSASELGGSYLTDHNN